ncbi:DUF5933 domain-containing protein [Streptomyces sp. NPDC001941]|uniref:phosphatase PAP2 family protein n=1 Tax=Streptomyces sp. NPDC001941 TaxID=3154659 RepID=UPI0033267593
MTALWISTGVVTLALFIALEIAARRYGVSGPATSLAEEFVLAPKSGPGLYAGLALTMVVLSRRERYVAAGAAIAIDLFFILLRWALHDELSFGNGALWVMLGCAVTAVARRTGGDRVLLLKGVGLGLLLIVGGKVGGTWLLITSHTRPLVLDQYVATADHALGNPSWLVGRVVEWSGSVGSHLLDFVYDQLAVAAVLVALYQLRNVVRDRAFPVHHLVRTFLVIGLVGPAIYMIFPVVGPVFAYGSHGGGWAVADVWPHALAFGAPQHMPFDAVTPRNCMPSLHTAWSTALFIHSRKGPRLLRYAGTFWLVATLSATLGFGYHYGADLVAGVVFTLTIEAALRAYDNNWDRKGIALVAYGVTVFAGLLLAYRFAATEMAAYPWFFGPLLILVLLSVIYAFVRTTKLWSAVPVPAPRAAEQQLVREPELV